MAASSGSRSGANRSEKPICGARPVASGKVGNQILRLFSARGAFLTTEPGRRFANRSEIRVVGKPVLEDDQARERMAGIFAGHQCVQWAGALGYVFPEVRPFVEEVARKTRVPDGAAVPDAKT